MCLAIPAKIISVSENDDDLQRMARVDFSGVIKDISLAYLPEAKVNDYVIVHAGLALSILDEDEARITLAAFAELANVQ
ncbi:MAG: HypC/HybG/HupF family hydrogenase formation chaperone [Methylococcaceae bacterium]|nr:HypC/HybG/HupF family hydrogenase formation chaperone [Methylococcaceae bacterium]MDD1617515.1 HypC/HybG/HupF family hydrogenase formation chaperone [Methylococcaceae bacterium]OYV15448.1 MAG: Hydrogenase maturation protein HypC [Methylococcaceae bacterium NSP1-2]